MNTRKITVVGNFHAPDNTPIEGTISFSPVGEPLESALVDGAVKGVEIPAGSYVVRVFGKYGSVVWGPQLVTIADGSNLNDFVPKAVL